MIAAIAFVAGWFVLLWGFVLAMHVKHLRDSGTALSWFWFVNLLPIVAVAVLLDFSFNMVAGTIMYLELPHELMFTSRCKRHVSDEGWRGSVARWWQRQLNQISKGHV